MPIAPEHQLVHVPPTAVGRAEDSDFHRVARLLADIDEDGVSPVVETLPACPRFFARDVFSGARARLRLASLSGGFTYFQGAVEGVGLSTFLSESAWVARTQTNGVQTPLLYWRVRESSAKPSKLIRSLSHRLGAPISHAAIRLEDTGELAEDILQALRAHRVRTIIVDHIHHLSEYSKAVLEDLMWATDPENTRGSRGPHQPHRISFIFASHLDPADTLGELPSLAAKLDFSPTVVEPYRLEDIAAVLHQIGLSWGPVDLDDPDDRGLVEAVFNETRGHVARMNPLFRAMLAVRRDDERPMATLVHHALHFCEGISDLRWEIRAESERRWDWESDLDFWLDVPRRRTRRTTKANPGPPPKALTPSQRATRKKAEQKASAASLGKKLARRPRTRKKNAR